jgi:hypothetical protein
MTWHGFCQRDRDLSPRRSALLVIALWQHRRPDESTLHGQSHRSEFAPHDIPVPDRLAEAFLAVIWAFTELIEARQACYGRPRALSTS